MRLGSLFPSRARAWRFLWGLAVLVGGDSAEAFFQAAFWQKPPINCPVGYIPVPPLAPYSPHEFCVSKYEMKNVGGVATSQAALGPWVNISRTTAITRCQSLGSGYHLISNAQWQTIARNIEAVPSNWSGGSVGSGVLNRGHTDNSPASALAANSNDQIACSGTGQTCDASTWNLQRRTHNLTNGKVIWDFAGNTWSWTRDNLADLGLSPGIAIGWNECSSLSSTNQEVFCSSVGTRNSAQEIGRVKGGSAGGVLRGGRWADTTNAGIFSVALDVAPTITYEGFGFRCVYVP